jgi:dihydroorotate dehydrogenase electron transfer subunit
MDLLCRVAAARRLCDDTVLLTVVSPRITASAMPGQFVNISCGCRDTYLRRPISICAVNRDDMTFDIGIQSRGKGTDLLCTVNAGDYLDIMGPLGKGFSLDRDDEKIVAIGGGIGIFPLLQLLREHPAKRKATLLGFRNRGSVVLEDEFRSAAHMLAISTDDGSYGEKGFVSALLEKFLEGERPDRAFICGPTPMMKQCVRMLKSAGIPSEVSMEQRMGCGIGACLVCSCKTAEGEDWNYSRVCRDGPVFDGESVIFD